jgi:hypothetical protein
MKLNPLNPADSMVDSIVQVRNFEEEKKIKAQAEALVRVWFDIKKNPDPVAREILDFMAKLKVDARVVEEAYKLLAVELGKK